MGRLAAKSMSPNLTTPYQVVGMAARPKPEVVVLRVDPLFRSVGYVRSGGVMLSSASKPSFPVPTYGGVRERNDGASRVGLARKGSGETLRRGLKSWFPQRGRSPPAMSRRDATTISSAAIKLSSTARVESTCISRVDTTGPPRRFVMPAG